MIKCVINCAYGGFSLPDAVAKMWGRESEWNWEPNDRTNRELVEWVEQHPLATDLGIALIPDEATDWEITEYDGWEDVIAVVDGKIVHISAED